MLRVVRTYTSSLSITKQLMSNLTPESLKNPGRVVTAVLNHHHCRREGKDIAEYYSNSNVDGEGNEMLGLPIRIRSLSTHGLLLYCCSYSHLLLLISMLLLKLLMSRLRLCCGNVYRRRYLHQQLDFLSTSPSTALRYVLVFLCPAPVKDVSKD